MTAGGARQHVYGAVRFDPSPYATFQLIRRSAAVSDSVIAEMRSVVESLRVLR